MSRFTKQLEEGRDLSYGHDHATGYFFQVFEPSEDGEEVLSVDECSMFTKMSNGKMIELMEKYDIQQSHIDRVVLDLPIE